MALFGKTKEEKVEKTEKKVVVKKDVKSKATISTPKDVSWVIKKSRITEKAAILSETVNAYVFDVDPRATKIDVKQAINEIYKVTPVKINIAAVPRKLASRRRSQSSKKGYSGGGKKAFVYLKKGERIEFV